MEKFESQNLQIPPYWSVNGRTKVGLVRKQHNNNNTVDHFAGPKFAQLIKNPQDMEVVRKGIQKDAH